MKVVEDADSAWKKVRLFLLENYVMKIHYWNVTIKNVVVVKLSLQQVLLFTRYHKSIATNHLFLCGFFPRDY
jgi:hypothetical protein